LLDVKGTVKGLLIIVNNLRLSALKVGDLNLRPVFLFRENFGLSVFDEPSFVLRSVIHPIHHSIHPF
jgi:hypothetical protein